MTELIPVTVACVQNYKDEKISLRFLLIDAFIIPGIFLSVYKTMVDKKEIAPIEKISQEEKSRIWKVVFEAVPDLAVEKKTSIAKCLYLIELFTNEQINTI